MTLRTDEQLIDDLVHVATIAMMGYPANSPAAVRRAVRVVLRELETEFAAADVGAIAACMHKLANVAARKDEE